MKLRVENIIGSRVIKIKKQNKSKKKVMAHKQLEGRVAKLIYPPLGLCDLIIQEASRI